MERSLNIHFFRAIALTNADEDFDGSSNTTKDKCSLILFNIKQRYSRGCNETLLSI